MLVNSSPHNLFRYRRWQGPHGRLEHIAIRIRGRASNQLARLRSPRLDAIDSQRFVGLWPDNRIFLRQAYIANIEGWWRGEPVERERVGTRRRVG